MNGGTGLHGDPDAVRDGAHGPSSDWHAANQRYLIAALAGVRVSIERRATEAGSVPGATDEPAAAAKRALEEAERAMPAPSALERLKRTLSLSPFERDVLLLCAGPEIDSSFSKCWQRTDAGLYRAAPTFGLALAMLPDPHWSALVPSAPLRWLRLVEMAPGEGLTTSPLRIDERVLHYLVGAPYLDERLATLVEPLPPPRGSIPASHMALVELAVRALTRDSRLPPAIQLVGVEGAGRRTIACAVAAALGCTLHVLSGATATFNDPATARLLSREAALGGLALLIDCDDLDLADAGRRIAIARLVDHMAGPVVLTSRSHLRFGSRSVMSLDVKKPLSAEQRLLWQEAVASTWPAFSAEHPRLEQGIDTLTAQFDLGAHSILAACVAAVACPAEVVSRSEDRLSRALWNACRSESRPRLDRLARRIEPAATWNDLVLPEAQRDTLREIAIHVKQRARVYESWGFASAGERGLGISALFAGSSGTGKTMAAEVLARELELDLYRVDLSQVVSKYIGETEKNLRRVFDAAEDGGAILFFDEADALFGKRSEVKDSHDRFANIEVSYLLQRIEVFRGLALLTTNLKSALDVAFLRRIRFVIQFPFPSPAQRAAIWRRVFPPNTPTAGLDPDRLAKMNVTGGNIRNIALNAAFLAADEGTPVLTKHVLRAARTEYAKLERVLTATESGE